MKASLNLRFSQNLALTPQLQQSIKLLQLSAFELEQELTQTAETNPLIEYEPPIEGATSEPIVELSHRASNNIRSNSEWDEAEDRFSRLSTPESLLDHLMTQIRVMRLSDSEKSLMGFLAGNLDERGFLSIHLDDLTEEVSNHINLEDGTPKEQLARALIRLQHLDPAGVGARDLAECLKLQLEAIPEHQHSARSWRLAHKICSDHIDLLASRDWSKLKRLLRATESEINDSVVVIKHLKHNPVAAFEQNSENILIPDVMVKKGKNGWQVTSNPDAQPKISINEEYAKVIKNNKNRDGIESLTQKLQEARWLVKNVLQRSETILKVAKAIVDRQQNFFNHGEVAMKPLVLREIADTLGLHESTISRVTTQKYMATPLGTYEFKYFFGSQVSTDAGGSVSSTAIRAIIKKFVEEEDSNKPLSDTQIAELLTAKGFVVARRTIAKYRDSLRIPAVHLRRK